MIITDRTHLVSTTDEKELHEFARKIGLKYVWYQNNNKAHPHYDLTTPAAVQRAFVNGAMEVTPYELLKLAWWASPP